MWFETAPQPSAKKRRQPHVQRAIRRVCDSVADFTAATGISSPTA